MDMAPHRENVSSLTHFTNLWSVTPQICCGSMAINLQVRLKILICSIFWCPLSILGDLLRENENGRLDLKEQLCKGVSHSNACQYSCICKYANEHLVLCINMSECSLCSEAGWKETERKKQVVESIQGHAMLRACPRFCEGNLSCSFQIPAVWLTDSFPLFSPVLSGEGMCYWDPDYCMWRNKIWSYHSQTE